MVGLLGGAQVVGWGGVRSCCHDCNRTSSKKRFSSEREASEESLLTRGALTLQGKSYLGIT